MSDYSIQTLQTRQFKTELLSKFISFTRFPLIVLVVLIHSHFTPTGYNLPYDTYLREYPLYCNMSYLCSELIARIAVPLFFVISGYLFFKRNTESYDLKDYKSKISSRIHSLFIPYVFWNALIFIITLVVQVVAGEGGEDAVINYSITDYFRIFWDIRDGMPFCYQLWFIRDLIVITLISPLIYHLLRNKKIAVFVLMIIAMYWIVEIDNVRWYLNSQSIMFFSLGAYFAIHDIDVVEKLRGVKIVSYISAIITVVYIMISFNNGCFYELPRNLRQCIYHLSILALLISFTNICLDNIIKNHWRENKFLLNSTFFIYGYHAVVLGYIYAFVNMIFHDKSDAFYTVMYILMPIVVVLLGLLIFFATKKIFPKLTGLITGGRQ